MHSRLLTAAIERLAQNYLDTNQAESNYAINNGLCEDFAGEILASMHWPEEALFMVVNENFMTADHEQWDWELLSKHWAIHPPTGLTPAEVDAIPFGGHAFLVFEQRFYDAECPQGVDSFFDLPLFRRPVEQALEAKVAPSPLPLPKRLRP